MHENVNEANAFYADRLNEPLDIRHVVQCDRMLPVHNDFFSHLHGTQKPTQQQLTTVVVNMVV